MKQTDGIYGCLFWSGFLAACWAVMETDYWGISSVALGLAFFPAILRWDYDVGHRVRAVERMCVDAVIDLPARLWRAFCVVAVVIFPPKRSKP
jgi:hypothetical protein